MTKQPTLTETVLDASCTRVVRTGGDGEIEDLTEAAPAPPPPPAVPRRPLPRR